MTLCLPPGPVSGFDAVIDPFYIAIAVSGGNSHIGQQLIRDRYVRLYSSVEHIIIANFNFSAAS